MKKAILIIIITVLAAAGIAAGISFWIPPFREPNIEGRLIGYECECGEDDGSKALIGIEEGIYEDLEKYPEKYRLYWIDMVIKNTTDHSIYHLNSRLARPYPGVWLLDPFTVYDIEIDLKEYEVIDDWGFYILVKTDSMSESEIDQLIRSIGLTIQAHHTTNAPVFASSTIYFENSSTA